MWRRLLYILIVAALIAGIGVWLFPVEWSFFEKDIPIKIENVGEKESGVSSASILEEKNAIEQADKVVIDMPVEKVAIPRSSLIESVPFTSQAPFAEWNDPIFQNGCEEAALVMAQYWLTGETLLKEIAKKEIIALSKYEKKEIGQSVDTSAKDTEKLLRDYYGVTTSSVHTGITLFDIQETLASGALVIVPADGRKLKNPNYTLPGPMTHMLVIIGYDAVKKEFITNDSGTRNGKNYRYSENVLFEAIRDYPTGEHLPIKGISKEMIVVKKK
jgi:hypothetical protein